MSSHRVDHLRNRLARVSLTGLPDLAMVLALLLLLVSTGCSESPSDPPSSAALGVRVIFPIDETSNASKRTPDDDTSPTHPNALSAGDPPHPNQASAGDLPHPNQALAGGIPLSISQIEASATELGDANVVRDRDAVTLDPGESHFALRLVVPPAQYYRIDVAARGTLGADESASEFGVIFQGQGFAMDVSASTENRVDVPLAMVVPEVSGVESRGVLALSWPTVPGAVRYRIRQGVGDLVFQTATSRTDTLIDVGSVARSFRVRSEFENGIVSAYSRAIETGNASSSDLRVIVVDAQTGGPLPGATVTFLEVSQVTDGGGVAQFTDLPVGTATVTVTADGYVEAVSEVTIVAGQLTTERIVLSRALTGGYRIILTWGEQPLDLDSHLVTPPIEDQVYRISWMNYGAENVPPFAVLDHDDTDSFGPETITIVQGVPGVYRFFVHNFSRMNDPESPPLSGSGATVTLIRGTEVINRVVVPATGTGDYWNVLTLDPKSVTVVVLNEIVDTPPAFSTGIPVEKSR